MGQPNRGSAGTAHVAAPVQSKGAPKAKGSENVKLGGPGGSGVKGSGKGCK